MSHRIILLLCTLAYISSISATPISGELSLSAIGYGATPSEYQVSTYYFPAYEIQHSFSDTWDYNLEFRWQLSWRSLMNSWDFSNEAISVRPYRMAVNLQGQHAEYIFGLQRINFGPALILRPLMWFDALDPTDPLKITRGVLGISTHHYYELGWSSQAWVLLSDQSKGWEIFRGMSGKIETGGRINIPNSYGQIGISTHYRTADVSSLFPDDPELYEGRIAFDGFWDLGLGLWVEAVYKHQELSSASFLDQVLAMIGSDYTLNIGNGLHVLSEHMVISNWNSPLVQNQTTVLSTAMLTYTLGMLDQFSLIIFHNWETNQPMSYLSWGQTYDNFRFTLAAFYSNIQGENIASKALSSGISGRGLQVTVIYNH